MLQETKIFPDVIQKLKRQYSVRAQLLNKLQNLTSKFEILRITLQQQPDVLYPKCQLMNMLKAVTTEEIFVILLLSKMKFTD